MARASLDTSPKLRVALFVEGSEPAETAVRSALGKIWNVHLPSALGLREFCAVYPISKKHLLAMDPENPPMSGAGEALDEYMVRMLKRAPFDAAVIAWDLVPAWNKVDGLCRWQETIDLYRLIAERTELEGSWRANARARWQELLRRRAPAARKGPPKLAKHEVLALCMDPMFEALLCVDEAGLRRALGLEGKRARQWPSGWSKAGMHEPDAKLLAPAVAAARGEKTPASRAVRGGWETSKNEWGEYLLRELLADRACKTKLLTHAICTRLAEVGAR